MTGTWITIFVILIIIELLTVNLVTIWFAIGSLIAAILSCFMDHFLLQFIIFVLVSGVTFLMTKPMLRQMKKKPKTKTNLDAIIGKTGTVTEEILPNEVGEIKVEGKRWSAISEQELPKDTLVTIKKITGVKLIVEKKKEVD